MSSARPQELPEYLSPPVIEVVIGAQFSGTPLEAVHIGALWEALRDEYPRARDKPPLNRVIESATPRHDSIQLQALSMPPLRRTFFESEDGVWLIQVQADRFHLNWRKKADNTYPHFEACYERFQREWKRFLDICAEGDAKLEPDQLELTYVNHVPKGEGWQALENIGGVFPDLSWRNKERFLPAPTGLQALLVFELPDGEGRLRATIKHAYRTEDRSPVFLCDLTARGYPAKQSSDMSAWFRQAREWIVKGFEDLTDEAVQRDAWGKHR